MLINFLKEVRSYRRKQGQKYETDKVLLLSILAISSGAISYRKIHQYISLKFPQLKKMFNLSWEKPPVYNAIRYILVNIDVESLEQEFRNYSQYLERTLSLDNSDKSDEKSDYLKKYMILSVDGKSLRGSFNNMEDQKMIHLLSVFNSDTKLILAQKEISEKTNEIPEFQEMIKELNLNTDKVIFTADAMHTQKKQ